MKISKPFKPKFCKQCKIKFTPDRPLQYVCSPVCAYQRAAEHKRKQINKQEKEDLKFLKEKLLTHKDYLKILQTVFNAFIRKRDSLLPCISCGVTKCEEFHAGHYIATTYQYLRFNEDNCWKQCSKCNTHLRGNSIPYRIELINRIGIERVEVLENERHNTIKLSIPEIKELIKTYKLKIKRT